MSRQWKRQSTYTYVLVDDQSSIVDGAFQGNWTSIQDESGANNNTLTYTTTPGSWLGVQFEGKCKMN